MFDRRGVVRAFGLGLAGTAMSGVASAVPSTARASTTAFRAAIADLERRNGGRLGVAVRDTGSGTVLAVRGDERFAMCSTFKFVLSAAILREVDRGRLTLAARVPIRAEDIVANSPVTERNIGPAGLTLGELCSATITRSDNAAANLLLARIGGPAGMTAFFRLAGDRVSRLDRFETMMSESKPGDPRDTTSPLAMLATNERLLLGPMLSEASRAQLTRWMVANTTGNDTIRAGVPAGWRVGDKTGSGDYGTRNDVGILWPPARKPVLLTLYYTGSDLPAERRNAVLAEATRLAVAALG